MSKRNHEPSRHVQEVLDKIWWFDTQDEISVYEIKQMFYLVGESLKRLDAKNRALESRLDRR